MKKALKILFFLCIFCLIEAKPPELTPHQTKRKIDEILKAHAHYKTVNCEVAERALKNFLTELDPIKTYLIDSEIAKWTSPQDEILEKVVSDYRNERFEAFDELYSIMLKAIDRREALETKILEKELPKEVDSSEFKDMAWAKNEEELENRLLKLRALQLEVAEKLDEVSKDQFQQRIAKRRQSHEQELIATSKENQKKQRLSLILKAISGAFDTHTVYFTPSEASQFMIQVQQKLFGIGAQLRDDLNGLTIVRLLEGGPAIKSTKLKIDDRIIAVGNVPIVGMDISEAVDLIRGPKGTNVQLTILRPQEDQKEEEKLEIEIERDEIVLKETRYESKTEPFGDGVIAHVHLYSFYQDAKSSSADDIRKILDEIRKEHKIHGLVLDLRNNAGGLLTQAVSVTGLFIKKGIVVSIKDHNGKVQHLRNFERKRAYKGPMIVLTNRASASASEIVAQTLQDYGRALIVGDKNTFGKGSYQTITLNSTDPNKVNPQGEYKVTRGIYYTVSGKSPQQIGALADIVVPSYLSEIEIGENFAKYPLKNDQIEPHFDDDLSDIHPFHRPKIRRTYKKHLQKKIEIYTPHITTLSANSKKRLENSTNYQNFLTELKKKDPSPETCYLYGQNDHQLDEAINVMKDLTLLTQKTAAQNP